MSLDIKRREHDGISILEMNGRLTFGQEDLLLNDEIRHAIAARRVHLVIDLSEVGKIDSAGLGTLLYARVELRRAGGGLALANLRAAHTRTLLIAKLETVFKVFDSQQDAIDSFFPERKVPHYDILELVTSMRQRGDSSDPKHAS